MLFAPEGIAHGFLTLTDASEVHYQMSVPFVPGAERGVRWDDPAFGIEWPGAVEVISERDAAVPRLPPMKVLVTGAGGFVGRQALDLLGAAGHEVHAVTRRTPPSDAPPAQWHRADLLDPVAAEALTRDVGATHLLHLAWCSEPGVYWTSSENLSWLGATLALLRSFAGHGGERAVLVGTCAEYDLAGGVCVEDETPMVPSTLYGSCKLATGLVASAAAANLGMQVAHGRIFYLYGPHEHPARARVVGDHRAAAGRTRRVHGRHAASRLPARP